MSDGTRYLEDGNPDFPEEMPIPLTRKTLGEAAKQALSLLSEAVEAEQATLMAFQEMERQRNVALEALKLAEQTAEGALDAQAEAEKQWFSARDKLKEVEIIVFDTDFTPSHGKSSRIERLERLLRK